MTIAPHQASRLTDTTIKMDDAARAVAQEGLRRRIAQLVAQLDPRAANPAESIDRSSGSSDGGEALSDREQAVLLGNLLVLVAHADEAALLPSLDGGAGTGTAQSTAQQQHSSAGVTARQLADLACRYLGPGTYAHSQVVRRYSANHRFVGLRVRHKVAGCLPFQRFPHQVQQCAHKVAHNQY
jgi:hypothetical protein